LSFKGEKGEPGMIGSSGNNMSTKVSMIVNVDKLLLQTKYIFQIPRDIQLSSPLISAFLMLLDTALAVLYSWQETKKLKLLHLLQNMVQFHVRRILQWSSFFPKSASNLLKISITKRSYWYWTIFVKLRVRGLLHYGNLCLMQSKRL